MNLLKNKEHTTKKNKKQQPVAELSLTSRTGTSVNAALETRVVIVIPTYNNERTILSVTEAALKTGLDVLVVNDGSTDKTRENLQGLPIRKIDLPVNKGKGAALKNATHWAKAQQYTHMLTMDADGQHNPADIPLFLTKMQTSPSAIIIGKRDFNQETVPSSSQFGRKFSNFWIKLLTGENVEDSQSGFRIYPVEVISQVKCHSNRYNFEVEILVRSLWAGSSVDFVDVSVLYSEQTKKDSHFHPWLDNYRISLTYTWLCLRHLCPIPHKRLKGKSRKKNIKEYLLSPRALLKMLFQENLSISKVVMACMLGILLGTLPLIAIHSVTIIFLAGRFRLNRMIALNISHLTAPPVVPALCIQIGHYLKFGRFIILNHETIRNLGYNIPGYFNDYLLGSTIAAPFLAALTGAVVYVLSHIVKWIKTNRQKAAAANKKKTNPYGSKWGIQFFYILIRFFSIHAAYYLLGLVVPFYALRPKIFREAGHYLKRRFPHDGLLRRCVRTMQYIYQFGLVLIDQAAMGLLGKDAFKVEFPEDYKLYNLAKESKGIVLLTSHVGTWQIAMAHMKCLGKPVNFIMHLDKNRPDLNFFDLSGDRNQFKIIDPVMFAGGMIPATNALLEKECVSVMGDRKMEWPTCNAPLLGEEAGFPLVAPQLAVVTDSDLVMFLTYRTGKLAYKIEYINLSLELAKEAGGGERLTKKERVQRYVELYARHLESYVSRNPYMWFNFFDFWKKGPKLK
jgi:predicted LPLAT superfamily acyltransferase/glycosyltransferase involved in cell wall biosynthesis